MKKIPAPEPFFSYTMIFEDKRGTNRTVMIQNVFKCSVLMYLVYHSAKIYVICII
jgi:hypothetical protein